MQVRNNQPIRRKKNDHYGIRKFLKKLRKWYYYQREQNKKKTNFIIFAVITALFLLFSKLSPSMGWVYLGIMFAFFNKKS